MRLIVTTTVVFTLLVSCISLAVADTIMNDFTAKKTFYLPGSATSSKENDRLYKAVETAPRQDAEPEQAIWPFNRKGDGDSDAIKPKSTRKAFFLSFLVPGLGETYVGSKRGLVFLGIEAFSWWLYLTNTNEGNDLEKDFQNFADSRWHYTETTSSQGEALDHNYYKWLQYHFREIGLDGDVDPTDYKKINDQLNETVKNSNSSIFGYSVHNLPSTKTQQYYEMIGKYPQFVYGWEDIDDTTVNPTIRIDGAINYEENISNIKSPMRKKYETMRDDSNDKLKAGQRGIHVMLLNRVVSAVHAARLAYKHNQKLDSELSTVEIHFVEKHIIDNNVPMLLISKKF